MIKKRQEFILCHTNNCPQKENRTFKTEQSVRNRTLPFLLFSLKINHLNVWHGFCSIKDVF